MQLRLIGLAAAALLMNSSAWAASFTSVNFFGDSLTDTGNVFLASGGTVPVTPYFNGRFSNGPVWAEYLATGLGLPAASTASFAGGNNYAFGGARTGNVSSPVPGLLTQVGGLWAPGHPVADQNGLYVLVGGMNDMRDARDSFGTDSTADKDGRQAAAEAAAANLATSLAFLASRGATNVLIANLFDLGWTPEAASLGLTSASSDASARFNALMNLVLSYGTSLGLQMYFLDMAGLMPQVRNDALNNGGAVYGITNVFTPCAPFQGNIGISCNVSLFSDALHPSARMHDIWGRAAAGLFSSTVPEPGTLALLGLGLAGLRLSRRRRAN